MVHSHALIIRAQPPADHLPYGVISPPTFGGSPASDPPQENEYRLAPSVAANVQVSPLTEGQYPLSEAIPLAKLPLNHQAAIVNLDESVQGFTRRRFLDLGLTPGAVISPELDNFFGDPRGYRLRGTLIALRREQAEKIKVKPL